MKILDNPSQEDLFALWLDELVAAGYVSYYSRTVKPFILSDIQEVSSNRKMNAVSYSPDFRIVWNDKAAGIFFGTFEKDECYFIADYSFDYAGYISYVDVKAPGGYGGRNSSDVSFPILQKLIFKLSHTYINKCQLMPNRKMKRIPKNYLFPHTFTPHRYFFTDKTMGPRTISKWDPIRLTEFVKTKK